MSSNPELAGSPTATADLATVMDLEQATTPTTTGDLGSADLLAPAPRAADYGSDGPMGVDKLPLTARSGLDVVVYAPSSSGAHPIVLLASGLQQPAAAYAPYAQRLASWGVVALLRDDPGFLQSSATVASDLVFLAGTWLPAQNADGSSKLHGRLDTSRIGLAGHSRGGQATLLAAEGDLHGKVKAWFGIDPVDSQPMGNAAQARTHLGSLGIPTAFLGETTDSAGGTGGMSCAPAADNFQVLYAAASSPSVMLTAVGADHTQFEDPASCSLCNLCTAGTADGATVLAYSVRYLTAFFARELLGDAAVGAAFQGAGAAADVAASRIQLSSK